MATAMNRHAIVAAEIGEFGARVLCVCGVAITRVGPRAADPAHPHPTGIDREQFATSCGRPNDPNERKSAGGPGRQ